MKFLITVIFIPTLFLILTLAAGMGFFSEELFYLFAKMTVTLSVVTFAMFCMFMQSLDKPRYEEKDDGR